MRRRMSNPRAAIRCSATSFRSTHEPATFHSRANSLPQMEFVIRKLNDYDLAHLLLMGATTDFTGGPLEELAGDGMFQHFRPLYNGHIIANVDMTLERGTRVIKAGLADSLYQGAGHSIYGEHYP